MGTERGIESKLVPSAGIPLHFLKVQGVRGKSAMSFIFAPFKVLAAIVQARSWFKQFKPHVVVGLGGYAAGPGGVAAWSLGIPLVIHEQNARAGTTNKILSKFAKRILVAFDGALAKSECIGNPVRKEIFQTAEASLRIRSNHAQPLRVLVLGGSLGARAINQLLPEVLAQLPEAERPIVVHQTGEKLLAETQNFYQQRGIQAEAQVVPFIDDMANALSETDFVICRSGALTVSEVAAAGVGALFVPYPYAIDDHQTANAQWLSKKGAAFVIQQADLTATKLQQLLLELSSDRDKLVAMANAARACAKPKATERFSQVCLEVASG